MALRAFLKRGLDSDSPGAIANSRLPKNAFKDWGSVELFKGPEPRCALFAAAVVGRGLIPTELQSDFSALASCGGRTELSCERQASNQYDANAIIFCSDDGRQLGFATRHLAAFLAPLLDSGHIKCGGLLRAQHAAVAAAHPASDVMIDVVIYFNQSSFMAAVHRGTGTLSAHLRIAAQRLREAWSADGRPCLPAKGAAAPSTSAANKRARTIAAAVHAAAAPPAAPDGRITSAQLLLTQPMPSPGSSEPGAAMSSDLAATLPQSILVRLFSCPGLSVRDLVLSLRPVCRKWRDVVDSPSCTPARRLFEFACRLQPAPQVQGILALVSSGPAVSPLSTSSSAAKQVAAVTAATGSSELPQPPQMPSWIDSAAPKNMVQLVSSLRTLVPFHLGTMLLTARWALWGGQPPAVEQAQTDPRGSMDALLQRIASMRLPLAACASDSCRVSAAADSAARAAADCTAAATGLPSSCTHKLHTQDGWVFISLCLMALPEWYVQQLLVVLLNTPRALEQAVTNSCHNHIMLKHEVLNALYLLIILVSTPTWMTATFNGPVGFGPSSGGGKMASALSNLQQLANLPKAASHHALVHDLVIGTYGQLSPKHDDQSAVPALRSAAQSSVLLGMANMAQGGSLTRKFSRLLVNFSHSYYPRPQPSAVFRVAKQGDSSAAEEATHGGSSAPAEAEEATSIWDSIRGKVSMSTSLSLADGRVHKLLSCIRSIENPLGGFARTDSKRGWTVGRSQRASAGPSTEPGSGGRQLTEEQQSIVNTSVKAGELLRVMAFAGSGKTTTLVEYARARPHVRMLYLVFNVSIREAAEGIFPPNVHVMSVHKMAYAAIGRRYPRIVSDLSFSVAREALGLPGNAFEIATWVKDTIRSFCQSADRALDIKHLPGAAASRVPNGFDTKAALASTPEHSVDPRTKKPRILFKAEHVLGLAQRLWNAMVSHADKAVPMTHDGYLKLYQMSRPRLSKDYGIILLDEAQDCAPVVAETVLSQQCGLVLVGDPHQSVYSFAGAVDTLSTAFSSGDSQLGADKRNVLVRRLTRSFRYGPEIARVAGSILRTRKAETEPLIGLPQSKRDDCVRWESPSPCMINRLTRQCCLPSIETDFQSAVPMSPLDSPLQPDILLARRKGHLRRLVQPSDFSVIDVGDTDGPLVALDTSDLDRNSTPWSVAILARLNVTLLCLAFELSHLVVDATAGPMAPYDPHALEAMYLRAARSRESSVNVQLRPRPDSVVRIAVIGATERNPKEAAFNMGVLEDICCLSLGAHGLIRDNLVKCFKSIQALDTFAERTNRSDLSSQIKFINSNGPGAVLKIIWRVRCCLVSDPAQADVVLGSVHKSKGLEFDEVILADDFISAEATAFAAQESMQELRSGSTSLSAWHEEQNLLYVAATRAKWQLWANEALSSLARGSNSASSVELHPISAGCEWVPTAAVQNALVAAQGSNEAPLWTSAGGCTQLADVSIEIKAPQRCGDPLLSTAAVPTAADFAIVPVLSPLKVVCAASTLLGATCAAGFILQALLGEEQRELAPLPDPQPPAAGPVDMMDLLVPDDDGRGGAGGHVHRVVRRQGVVRRRERPAQPAAVAVAALPVQPPRALVRRPRDGSGGQAAAAAAAAHSYGVASSPPRQLVRRRPKVAAHDCVAVAAAGAAAAQPQGSSAPGRRSELGQRAAGNNDDLLASVSDSNSDEGSDDVIVIDSD